MENNKCVLEVMWPQSNITHRDIDSGLLSLVCSGIYKLSCYIMPKSRMSPHSVLTLPGLPVMKNI